MLALRTAVGVFRYAGQHVWDGAELSFVLLSVVLVYLSRGWSRPRCGSNPAAADLLARAGRETIAAGGEPDPEPAATVDAADTERRRMERDLRDGARQHLVSLAMNIGLARATLARGSPSRRARRCRKRTRSEGGTRRLRELVRGLRPVVLEDRGLDAALTGIAPAPPCVRLGVDVPRRVSPAVEAVRYFVVSRALANVNKARPGRGSAGGRAVRRPDAADLDHGRRDRRRGRGRGTGLTGLAQRAG